MENLITKKTETIQKKKYDQCNIEIVKIDKVDIVTTSNNNYEYTDPWSNVYEDQYRKKEEYISNIEDDLEEKRQNGTLSSSDIAEAINKAGVNGYTMEPKWYGERDRLKENENSND